MSKTQGTDHNGIGYHACVVATNWVERPGAKHPACSCTIVKGDHTHAENSNACLLVVPIAISLALLISSSLSSVLTLSSLSIRKLYSRLARTFLETSLINFLSLHMSWLMDFPVFILFSPLCLCFLWSESLWYRALRCWRGGRWGVRQQIPSSFAICVKSAFHISLVHAFWRAFSWLSSSNSDNNGPFICFWQLLYFFQHSQSAFSFSLFASNSFMNCTTCHCVHPAFWNQHLSFKICLECWVVGVEGRGGSSLMRA